MRRCLETAAIVARELEVASIEVNERLSESTAAIARDFRHRGKEYSRIFTLLHMSVDDAAATVGDRKLVWDPSAAPAE
jgi:hypothetical protein